MEHTRYVQIPCRVCGCKTFVIGSREWPKKCVRCRAPFNTETRAFALPDVRPPSSRWGDEGPQE
jgi:hypothetical protein